MHPMMKIRHGRDTEARLARKYGANLVEALCVIDHWIRAARDKDSIRAVEATGGRLFYQDGLFDDLMLRIYRAPTSVGDQLHLVLAKLYITLRQRGRGHCSDLLSNLEAHAKAVDGRFIVESANPDMSAILRQRQNYYPYDFNIGVTSEPTGRFGHWLFDPRNDKLLRDRGSP